MQIRKINIKDRDIYLELVNEFYNSEAVLHPVDSINFEITFNTLISSDIYTECYVMEDYEKIFGYCLLSKTYSQEVGGMVCLVEELYLRDEYRSKGIGSKVFEFLKEKFKDYKRIRLEVEVNNKRGIKLYNSIGFNELKYMQMVCDDIK